MFSVSLGDWRREQELGDGPMIRERKNTSAEMGNLGGSEREEDEDEGDPFLFIGEGDETANPRFRDNSFNGKVATVGTRNRGIRGDFIGN
jgi:hypothetical protein